MRRPSGSLVGLVGGFVAGLLVVAAIAPDGGEEAAREASGRVEAGDRQSGAEGLAGVPGADPTEESDGAVVTDGGGTSTDGGASAAAPTGDGGGTAPSGGAAASSDDGAPAEGGAAPPTRNVRGVTADSITIGVGLLNLGALKALGPAFDNGDRKAHFESILAGWKRDKVVPVHGRDIKFVYREYDPVNQPTQRSACAGLIQDAKSFAVIFDSTSPVGSECVAREYGTPVITSDAPGDEVFARSKGNLFTLQMSLGRMFRNLPHFAKAEGVLVPGKSRVGIYYLDDVAQRTLVDTALRPELTKLGFKPVVEATTDQALGGPRDSLAVRQFQAAQVNVAILITSKAGFMQQAEANQYRPRYLETDLLSGTTNTATSTYPAEHFNGAKAITGQRYGEWKAGIAPPASARACVETYRKASGQTIDANAREAEYVALNKACDATQVLMLALQRAGPDLTHAGLVAALESIKDLQLSIHGDVTFAPGKHHGTELQRTLEWTSACRCWRAKGVFGPLWVG